MKMLDQLKDLHKFTVEEFESDFDNLITRVENGESFIIQSEYGNAVIVPYKKVTQVLGKVKGENSNEIEN